MRRTVHVLLSVKLLSLCRSDIDFNLDTLSCTSQRDALDRSNVAIISTPGQSDVTVRNHQVIGGIKADPSGVGNENRHPRVRSLCTLNLRTRANVTADVSRRQSQ